MRRDFRAMDPRECRVLLVEAADRVLTSFPPSLSHKAERSLERLGVTPLVQRTVVDMDGHAVTVQAPDGATEQIPARTVIWAAGVNASSLAGRLAELSGAEVDRAGRIAVEPDLSLPGHPEVLALGDMVRVRNADGEAEVLPGVAPVAMQQGRYAAKLVRGRLSGRDVGPFRYRDKGNLATIGRAAAVADLHGIRLSGYIAWVAWLVIHLYYLIGFQNRLLVLIRWAFSFVTPRARRATDHAHGGLMEDAARRFLDGLLAACRADPRILGVTLAGSAATGQMDEFSDVDTVIVSTDESHAELLAGAPAFAASIGPLLAAFTGEHVGEPRLLIALYGPPLLHVDLKFVGLWLRRRAAGGDRALPGAARPGGRAPRRRRGGERRLPRGGRQPRRARLEVALLGQARRAARGLAVAASRAASARRPSRAGARAPRAGGGGRPCARRRRASPAARGPACGPWTIATATAWLSVTIGLGARRSSSS